MEARIRKPKSASFFEFIFLAFFLTLPFQFAISPTGHIDLHISRILSIFIGALWIIRSLLRRSLRLHIGSIPLLVFLFFSIFSLFFAEHLEWGLRKIAFLISFVPIFFAASDLFSSGEKSLQLTFLRCLVVGAALSGVVGIVQSVLPFIIGLDPSIAIWKQYFLPLFLGEASSKTIAEYSSMVANVGGNNAFRSSAFFPDPHMASFFWGMTLPLSIALAIPIKGLGSLKWILASAIILLADLLTFSRGGFFALIGAGLVILQESFSHVSRRGILIFIAFTCLTALIVLIPNPLSARFASSFNVQDHSNSGRLAIWREAALIIKDHPFSGVGIGNYSSTVKPSADYREPRYAHNIFLDISAETGIVNGFLFLIFIAISCFYALRHRSAARAAGFSIIIFLIHSIFETPIYSVHILPLFLAIIALSLSDQNKGCRSGATLCR